MSCEQILEFKCQSISKTDFMGKSSWCLSFAPFSMLFVFCFCLSCLSVDCCQTLSQGFLSKLSLHLPSYFKSDLLGRESCENHPFAIWYQLQIASWLGVRTLSTYPSQCWDPICLEPVNVLGILLYSLWVYMCHNTVVSGRECFFGVNYHLWPWKYFFFSHRSLNFERRDLINISHLRVSALKSLALHNLFRGWQILIRSLDWEGVTIKCAYFWKWRIKTKFK